MSQPKVEVVVKNSCTSIGEGPHWDESSQCLLYVDIKSMDVHRLNPVTGQDDTKHLKDTVSYVIPRRAGGYMVGLGRRLSLFEWDTGMISTIQEVEHDRGTRLNDAKCDPRGRLWAGTMGPELGNAKVEPESGALYMMDLDRSVEKKLGKIHISNGLAWSMDQRTMFYIDSTPRQVYAFDYDVNTGNIKNQRVAVQFPDPVSEYGLPDGMTIDTDGKLWVASYNAGAVFRFDPETGKVLQRIDIPGAKQTTSVCWGGKNLDEMYVTCARAFMTEEQFRTEQPNAGSIFKITGLGAKGQPAFVYEG